MFSRSVAVPVAKYIGGIAWNTPDHARIRSCWRFRGTVAAITAKQRSAIHRAAVSGELIREQDDNFRLCTFVDTRQHVLSRDGDLIHRRIRQSP